MKGSPCCSDSTMITIDQTEINQLADQGQDQLATHEEDILADNVGEDGEMSTVLLGSAIHPEKENLVDYV